MNELVVKNVKHSYRDSYGDDEQLRVRETAVLKGVNATFGAGNIYAIVGESGSGKTTLISLVAGLEKVQHGDITFNGQSIADIGASNWRLKHVNIVFQAYNLIRYMTARENVEVALDFSGHDKNEKNTAYELLDSVGISHAKADRLVQKLSGGEQQRVAIARAMAGEVEIIVADEPTGNLDEKTEGKVLALFKQLALDGKIVIIVTHSSRVARELDAAVLRMKSGQLDERKSRTSRADKKRGKR